MRSWQQWQSSFSRWSGGLVLAATLGWVGVASADRFPPDPVEELRQTLKAPVRNPAARAEALAKEVEALRTIGDLRRALLLQEWRDEEELDETVRKIDLANRNKIVKRFEEEVKAILAHGTMSSQLAVAQMLSDQVLGEIGRTQRGTRIRANVGAFFGPEMAELARTGSPPVRLAAARALGRMNAKPDIAVPALSDLLASADPAQRLAAADGLVNLVTVSQTVSRLSSDIVSAGQAVAPVAARALRDPNPEVRRLAADALYQAAASLSRQVPEPGQRDELGDPAEARKDALEKRAELLPLIRALQEQTPVLAQALSDPDPQVRLLAGQALEELGSTRLRFQRQLETLSTGSMGRRPDQAAEVLLVSAEQAAPAEDDPLLQALRQTLPALQRALSDPDVRVRIAALDVLETLGPNARPAAAELIKALADPDRFVRWAAARTLGKAGPVEDAVPELSRLLFDADLDLCLAAARALERFGPAAKGAVPALVKALGASDAEMRLTTLHALEGIGTDAQSAIPALAVVLADPDLRVRRTAAEVLGKFGPLARSAEAALRRTLEDSNAEVRQAAGDALLSILR